MVFRNLTSCPYLAFNCCNYRILMVFCMCKCQDYDFVVSESGFFPLSVHCIGKNPKRELFMAKKKVKDIVGELLDDFLKEHDLELFQVEYVKEGKERYLRVYIDKPEKADGGEQYVDIEECEMVSRYLSEKLDEEDPIAENYYLEVSSPGLDRPLIREDDYRRFSGRMVDVSLYKAFEGRKQFSAQLGGLAEGIVSFKEENGNLFEIPLDQISKINLTVII